MFHDHQSLHYFSQEQNLAAAGPLGAALTLSSNRVDLQANRDISEGENLYVRLMVTTSFATGGGVPRLLIGLAFADNEAMTVNLAMPIALTGGAPLLLGATDNVGSPAGYLTGGLAARQELLLPIPPSQYTRQRWMGVLYIQPSWLTAYFSAGRITAHIVHNPPQRTIYPDGIA